jgi:hypothetical protein
MLMIKKIYFLIIFLVINIYQAQEDCVSAIALCGNSAINYTPSGIGNVNENLGGCLATGEHNSVWYKFTIATSGTLTFDLQERTARLAASLVNEWFMI